VATGNSTGKTAGANGNGNTNTKQQQQLDTDLNGWDG
jgi:hypothetical protein